MARKHEEAGGNAGKLIFAWALVGIPLSWGVVQTCLNALQLFK